MIFIDAHVHIHHCFDLQVFLDSSFANFKTQAAYYGEENNFSAFLLLTESKSENWFQYLADYARNGHVIGGTTSKKWSFHPTQENCSLQAICNGNQNLFLLAGRQIVTAERLEVLALATEKQFKDGAPIETLIKSVQNAGALSVIPYGFGKWIGRRGILLKDLLEKVNSPDFFLGDNSGRPNFLPLPSHFVQADKKGIRVLPGSDPLPFPSESGRAGSFGFAVNESISSSHPARDLKNILLNPDTAFRCYGCLETFPRFLINQFSMQFVKHRPARKVSAT